MVTPSPVPLDEFELETDHWDLVQRFISRNMEAQGFNDPAQLLLFMKKNWKRLVDMPALRISELDGELLELKTRRDREDVDRVALDARITELEATRRT